MEAGRNGHADCARLLLDAGADTSTKCNVRVRGVGECGAFCFALRAVVEFTVYSFTLIPPKRRAATKSCGGKY